MVEIFNFFRITVVFIRGAVSIPVGFIPVVVLNHVVVLFMG